MTLTFAPNLPADYRKGPIVISGEASLPYPAQEYILGWEGEECVAIYEIRYNAHTDPFKEAGFLGSLLGAGHEEYFYLFDTKAWENRLTLPMEGYFGHLYVADDRFYVADAYGLYCIDKTGTVCWHNDKLGIDGVCVNRFDGPHLFGEGEWDPPGGWRDFVLDKQTGELVQ
ncbi:MAG TPA: hypothetical protein VNS58_09005 [Puia sp.]|nr:hypothetical protein [Puia sp.]